MKQLSILAAALAIAAGQTYIGRVDTIGGTTYDWWSSAQAVKNLASSPGFGMHAVWMYSSSTSGSSFPDRNMRYNYCGYATRQWSWTAPDYMGSGENVFMARSGYGNVDPDPTTGCAVVSGHTADTTIRPTVARDVEPGAGVFEYADGPGAQWPRIATGQNGTISILMISAAYAMSYSRIAAGNWPTFDTLRQVDPSGGFPTHAAAASKISGKVCIIWEMSTDMPEDGYVQTSSDNGETWTSSQQFLPPDAFGGDTVTSFSITSLYPWYDYEDRLHIVANVSPMVGDTIFTTPSQIWHWCEDNQPEWSRIHIAICRPENMQASVGYNSTYACRPSIGESDNGRLYVAWEQFDSSNVEPTTSRLRAGIWVSGSSDNGLTWTPGMPVTERNTSSHRFPSVVDRMIPSGPSEDTVCVLYLMDQVAGFFVQNEGPATPNPVICQFIPSTLVGVKERSKPQASCLKPVATIVRGVLNLGVDSRQYSGYRGELLDAAGRKVIDLRSGANDVRTLAPGVYFIRAASRKPSAVSCSKVLVMR